MTAYDRSMVDCRVFEEEFFDDHDVESRTYSPTHRRMTRQHRLLLEQFGQPSTAWSSRALHACLETLASNTWSEAWCVGILDAWVEGDSAFCVVYRYADAPHTLGTRRLVDDHGDPYGPGADDPEQFGRNVATGDISEPLGTVARALQSDAAGVYWWGSLGEFLPSPPDAHQGAVMPADPRTRTRCLRDMPAEAIEAAILGEIRYVNDWVSLAAAFAPLGTSSWAATPRDVQRVLDCINTSARLRLGRVGNRFDEIPKPLPVSALVGQIIGGETPADRSASMMALFIAPS